MIRSLHLLAALLATLAVPSLGCQSAEPGGDDTCTDGKCDDPGTTANKECKEKCGADDACFTECRTEKALDHCDARREDAVLSAQRAFTETAIRWACSDVEGVNTNGGDDRGQEYCEYYAIVAPPPAAEGEAAPAPVDLGRAGSSTPLGIELTEDQIFALEDNPTAVVGECVFTSWHADIRDELPICDGSAVTCPEFELAESAQLPPWMTARALGKKMTQEMLRMKVGFNSNGAASDLAEKCMVAPEPPQLSEDAAQDVYMRGCMKAFNLFGTEWRRSDPTICAATARAAECGCGVDTNADGVADITDPTEIAFALVPRQPTADGVTMRGFRLGTWSDENGLPAGCRYLDTGDSSNTAVACDLTGSDLLANASDVKNACRAKYGDNVVVHIPVPKDAMVCTPPADGKYSATCGETVPWTQAD